MRADALVQVRAGPVGSPRQAREIARRVEQSADVNRQRAVVGVAADLLADALARQDARLHADRREARSRPLEVVHVEAA